MNPLKIKMNKNEPNIVEEKDSGPKQIFSNAKEAINNFVKGHSRSNSETFVDEKKKKRQWFTVRCELCEYSLSNYYCILFRKLKRN